MANKPQIRRMFPKGAPSYGRDLKSDLLKYIRVGVITRVDYETGLVDVLWLDAKGERTNLHIPSAYGSLRGTIRGMPEVNSHVICGFMRLEQKMDKPVILGYVDFSTKNPYEYRLLRQKAPPTLAEITKMQDKIGYGVIRTKRRKLYPGEIQIESTQGSELFLDENVYISNSVLNEIELLSDDQSIRLSSKQQYHSTNASKIWNGMVSREILNNQITPPQFFSNGHKVQYITEDNNQLGLGGRAFTEYRIEVAKNSDDTLKINEFNSGYDANPLQPFVSFVMGTVVGNNKNDEFYGKILRPQIFSTLNIASASLNRDVICKSTELDIATAFQLRINSSGTSIDIDREGRLFTNIAASTGKHPDGAGRSWDANFAGTIKWAVGTNKLDGTSINLYTEGKIKEVIGVDEDRQSKDTVTTGGVSLNILNPNNAGFGYQLICSGNSEIIVNNGSYSVDASDGVNFATNGLLQVTVGGQYSSTTNNNVMYVGGDEDNTVIGNNNILIGGGRVTKITNVAVGIPPIKPIADDIQIALGSHRTVIGPLIPSAGNIEEKINGVGNITQEVVVAGNITSKTLVGNITKDVKTGSIKNTVLVGSIENKVTTGSLKNTVTTGSVKTVVSVGNIEISTATGNVSINATTGIVTVQGNLKVVVKSGVKIELSSPFVDIGSSPAKSGVVVSSMALDPLTGIPHIGSTTVSASL